MRSAAAVPRSAPQLLNIALVPVLYTLHTLLTINIIITIYYYNTEHNLRAPGLNQLLLLLLLYTVLRIFFTIVTRRTLYI